MENVIKKTNETEIVNIDYYSKEALNALKFVGVSELVEDKSKTQKLKLIRSSLKEVGIANTDIINDDRFKTINAEIVELLMTVSTKLYDYQNTPQS